MIHLPRFASTSLNLESQAYVRLGENKSMKTLLSFSVETWVNLKHLDGIQTIVSNQSDDGIEKKFKLIVENGYPVAYYGGNECSLKAPKKITSEAWHNIAMTYDSRDGGELKLYLDGVLVALGAFPFIPQGIGTNAVLIGANLDLEPTDFLNGMIGRVEIWSSCRTLDEIVKDSLLVSDPLAEANLETHFDFTDLPAVDQSGNNISLNLMSGANYVVCVPAVEFDGEGYVSCGKRDALKFSNKGSFTIEGWFYAPNGSSGTIVSGIDQEFVISIEGSIVNVNDVIYSQPIVHSINVYHHFATVYNAKDKTLSLYINGNLQVSKYYWHNQISDQNSDFLIGARMKENRITDNFGGEIQIVRAWSKALSTSEIQQWIINQPVNDLNLRGSFDFSVLPPVDNTNQNEVSLKSGARFQFNKAQLNPLELISKLGGFQSLNSSYLNQYDPVPDSYPTIDETISFDAINSKFDHSEFLEMLQADLENFMEAKGMEANQKLDYDKRFQESYKEARNIIADNPNLLKGFTINRSQSTVQIIHHGIHGDELVFEGDSNAVDDCTIWWMTFIFSVSVGFFQALGLLPSTGDIMTRIYNLVSRNQRVIDFMATVIGKAITVTAGITIIKVLYDEGLIWPILKFVFASAGWWSLFWILKKLIAFVTGTQAAELLSGFVVWALQLTNHSLNFQSSCTTKKYLINQ